MKIRNALIGFAVIGAAATALAWPGGDPPPPPPPPPPPSLNDCSPGFWKNHEEAWAQTGQYCGSSPAVCVADIMADLTSQGKGSGELRHDAAALLNAWADDYYLAKICTE